MQMLDKLTSADFTPLLQQSFQIHAEMIEPVTAELIEVTELGPEPEEDGIVSRRAFSLIFRISGDAYLSQQIYHVEHDALPGLDIFLVPLGPDKVGMKYEAMFT